MELPGSLELNNANGRELRPVVVLRRGTRYLETRDGSHEFCDRSLPIRFLSVLGPLARNIQANRFVEWQHSRSRSYLTSALYGRKCLARISSEGDRKSTRLNSSHSQIS